MSKVVIEFDRSRRDALLAAAKDLGDEFALVQSDKLEGATQQIIAVVATLSGVTIGTIGKIVIEEIKAKRHIVIKKKGITIRGLSEKNALRIIQRLSDDS